MDWMLDWDPEVGHPILHAYSVLTPEVRKGRAGYDESGMPRIRRLPVLVSRIFLGFVSAIALIMMNTHTSGEEIRLPGIIGSNMVLQRGMPVPIWGWATPGQTVTVSFLKQRKTAAAGKDGKWMVRLAPLEAGGPFEMVISGGAGITLTNVLVGEVWLGSGQSNMGVSVGYHTQNRLRPGTGFDWHAGGVLLISAFTATVSSLITASRMQSKIDSTNDLRRLRVGTVTDSAGEDYLRYHHIRFRPFDTLEEALQCLDNSRLDLVIHDLPSLNYYIT